MKIKDELNALKQKDIYSLILFILFKLKNISEYSTLSELIYILDKDSILKLCEYFGGQYIKIPTIDELESIIYALMLYEKIDLNNINYDEAVKSIASFTDNIKEIISLYRQIKVLISDYEFKPR